jgi:hypothetical protein
VANPAELTCSGTQARFNGNNIVFNGQKMRIGKIDYQQHMVVGSDVIYSGDTSVLSLTINDGSSVTLNAGVTLTISSLDGSNYSFNNLNVTGGKGWIDNNGTTKFTSTSSSPACKIHTNGTGTQEDFYGVTFDGTGTWVLDGHDIKINYILTMNQGTFNMTGNNVIAEYFDLNTNGTCDVDSGTITNAASTGCDVWEGNIYGALDMSGGSVTLREPGANVINFYCNLTISNGTLTVNPNALYGIKFGVATGSIFSFSSGTLNLNGNTTFDDMNYTISGGTIYLSGSFTDASSASYPFDPTGGNFYVTGSTDTNITLLADSNFYQLYISKNAGIKATLLSQLDVNGNMEIMGGILESNGFDIDVAWYFWMAGGNYHQTGSTTMTCGSGGYYPDGSSIVDIDGGTFTNNYLGSAAQSSQFDISSGTVTITYSSTPTFNGAITVGGGTFTINTTGGTSSIYMYGSITLSAGTLALNPGSAASTIANSSGKTINILGTGVLDCSGSVTFNDATYSITAGKIYASGSVAVTAGVTFDLNASNTFYMDGTTGTQYITFNTPATQKFGSLRIKNSGHTVELRSDMTCNGTFYNGESGSETPTFDVSTTDYSVTVNGSGSMWWYGTVNGRDAAFTVSGAQLYCAGTVDFDSGTTHSFNTIYMYSGTTYFGSSTVDVNYYEAGGGGQSFYIYPSATVDAESSMLNIRGNFKTDGTFTAGTGTVKIIGSVNQTMSGSSNPTLNNLTLTDDGATAARWVYVGNSADNSYVLTVSKAFVWDANAWKVHLTVGTGGKTATLSLTSATVTESAMAIPTGTGGASALTLSGSSTLNLKGNFSLAGAFTCNTSTVTFDGSADQDITATGGSVTFSGLTINNSSANYTAIEGGTGDGAGVCIVVGGSLTITDGTLELNDYTGAGKELDVAGNVTISLNAGLNANDTNTSVEFAGGFNNSNTTNDSYIGFNAYSGNVVLFNATSGSVPITMGGTTGGGAYLSGITFNDGGGGATYSLGSGMNVSGTLTITSGTLNLGFYSLFVSSNFTNNGNVSAGTSSVSFQDAGDLDGSSTTNFYNVTFSGSATRNVKRGFTVVSGGSAMVNSGATLSINASGNIVTIILTQGTTLTNNQTVIIADSTNLVSLLGTGIGAIYAGNNINFNGKTMTIGLIDYQTGMVISSDVIYSSNTTVDSLTILDGSSATLNAGVTLTIDSLNASFYSFDNQNITGGKGWIDNGGTTKFTSTSTSCLIHTNGTGTQEDFYIVQFNPSSGGKWALKDSAMKITNNLTISAGELTNYDGANYWNLTVDGTVSITGTLTFLCTSGDIKSVTIGGSLTVAGTLYCTNAWPNIYVAGNWNSSSGTFNCGYSDTYLNGSAAGQSINSAHAFDTLYINNTNASGTTIAGSQISVNSYLFINNLLDLSSGSRTITADRIYVNDADGGPTGKLDLRSSSTVNVAIINLGTASTGQIDCNGASPTINISYQFNIGATGTFTAGNSMVNYNGNQAQTVTSTIYYNLILSGGLTTFKAKTLGGAVTATTVTVNGAYTEFGLNGCQLSIVTSFTMNDGKFSATIAGSIVTRSGAGNYSFEIKKGTVNVTNLAFSFADSNGLHLSLASGDISITAFNNVAFTSGLTTHMKLGSNVTNKFTSLGSPWSGCSFAWVALGNPYNISNVAGSTQTGSVAMTSYSGAGAGELNDQDSVGISINWASSTNGYWDGGGSTSNWSEATNWGNDTLPAAAEIIVYDGAYTGKSCNVNTTTPTIASVTTQNSYTATITVDSGNTLTVSGNTVLGNTSSVVTLTVGGALHADGTINVQTGCTLNGTGSITVSYSPTDPFIGTGTITLSSLSVNYDALANQAIRPATFGALILSGNGNKTANGAIIVNGDVSISTATFVAGNYVHNIKGSWYNGGIFTPGTGTIIFSGTGNQTIYNSVTEANGSFNNLTIDDSGARTVTIYSTNVTPKIAVAGVFFWDATVTTSAVNLQIGYSSTSSILKLTSATVTDSSIIIPSTKSLTMITTSAIDLAGYWTNNGTFTPAQSIITFIGSNPQTVTTGGTGTGKPFNGFVVNSGSTVSLAGDLSAKDLTISGGILDVTGSNYIIYLTGNWTNSATFAPRASGVEFNGTSTINAGGTTAGKAFNNVTLGGTSAILSITNMDINGNFALTTGTFDQNGLYIYLARNWNNTGTTYTANSGIVYFDAAAGSQNVTCNTSAFYSVYVGQSSGTNTTVVCLDTFRATGNVYIYDTLNPNGYNIGLNATRPNLVVIQNTGVLQPASPITMYLNNVWISSGGTLDLSGATVTIYSSMGLVNESSTPAPNFSGSTVIFDSTSSRINSRQPITFNNVTIDDTANRTFVISSDLGNSTVTITGQFIWDAIAPTTTASITLGDDAATDYSCGLILNNATATNSSITIPSGEFLQCIAATSGGLTSDIMLKGNWSNSGTFTPNGNKVTFNGTTTGLTIGGSTDPGTFYDIDLTGVGGGWTFTQNVTVSHILNFATGALNGGTGSQITFSGAGIIPFQHSVTWNPGTSNVIYTGAGSTVNSLYYDLTISAVETLGAFCTVQHDFSITNTGSLDVGTFDMEVGHSFINGSGGTFTPRSQKVTFYYYTNGSGGTINNGTSSFYDMTVNPSTACTFTLANAITVTNLLWVSTGTLDTSGSNYNITGKDLTINGGTLTLNGSNNVDLSGNFNFSSGTLNGNTSWMHIAGTWTHSGGTYNYNTSKVEFDHNAALTLPSETWYYLIIDRSAAITVYLGGNITVSDTLEMQTGTLDNATDAIRTAFSKVTGGTLWMNGTAMNNAVVRFSDRTDITFSNNLNLYTGKLYVTSKAATTTVTASKQMEIFANMGVWVTGYSSSAVATLKVNSSGSSACMIDGSVYAEDYGILDFTNTIVNITQIAGSSGLLKLTGSNTTIKQISNLNIRPAASGTGTLQLWGNSIDALEVTGNLTIYASGTISAFDGGTDYTPVMKVGGDWTNNGIFIAGNSTVTFDGTGNLTLNSGGFDDNHDFAKVLFDNSSGKWTLSSYAMKVTTTLYVLAGEFDNDKWNLTLAGTEIDIGAKMTFKNATMTGSYVSNSGIFNVSSDATACTVTLTSFLDVDSDGDMTLTGGSNSSYYVYVDTGSLTSTLDGHIHINDFSTLDCTGAGLDIGKFAAGGLLELNTTTSSLKTGDLTIARNLSATLDINASITAAGAINIAGNLIIGSNGTLDCTGFGPNIEVLGNWTNNGTFTEGSSTVTFDGSSVEQTIGGTFFSTTFFNLTFSNNCQRTINSGQTITVNGTFLWNDGDFKIGNPASAFFKLTSSLVSDSSIIIPSGRTLDIPMASTIELKGNWTNSGTFIANISTITFNGSVAQVITTGGTGVMKRFSNLTIANTGDPSVFRVSLATDDLDIVNDLTINDGAFDSSGLTIRIAGNLDLNADALVLRAGTFVHMVTGAKTVYIANGSKLVVKGVQSSHVTFDRGGGAGNYGFMINGEIDALFADIYYSSGVSINSVATITKLNQITFDYTTGTAHLINNNTSTELINCTFKNDAPTSVTYDVSSTAAGTEVNLYNSKRGMANDNIGSGDVKWINILIAYVDYNHVLKGNGGFMLFNNNSKLNNGDYDVPIDNWTLYNNAGTAVHTVPASTTLKWNHYYPSDLHVPLSNVQLYTRSNWQASDTALGQSDALALYHAGSPQMVDFVCWGTPGSLPTGGVEYTNAKNNGNWNPTDYVDITGFGSGTSYILQRKNTATPPPPLQDTNTKNDWECVPELSEIVATLLPVIVIVLALGLWFLLRRKRKILYTRRPVTQCTLRTPLAIRDTGLEGRAGR